MWRMNSYLLKKAQKMEQSEIPSHKSIEFQSLVSHFTHSFTQPIFTGQTSCLGHWARQPGARILTQETTMDQVCKTRSSLPMWTRHTHLGQVLLSRCFGKINWITALLHGWLGSRFWWLKAAVYRKQLCSAHWYIVKKVWAPRPRLNKIFIKVRKRQWPPLRPGC